MVTTAFCIAAILLRILCGNRVEEGEERHSNVSPRSGQKIWRIRAKPETTLKSAAETNDFSGISRLE
jgi:hypothetical protein